MRYQLPFTLLLAGSAVACVGQTATTDVATVTSNLDQPNGGFDTADEAPMFGADAEIAAAAIEPDAPVTDTMASDPAVTAMDQAPTTGGHDMILLWGRLPGDPLSQVARNWSGTLSLSRGALVVRRTIAFEDRTDHLLPRTSPTTVAFDSVTRPFADGLALRVIDPSPTAIDALTLTYTSTPPAGSTVPSVSYTFDLSQLAAGPIVVDAGDGFKMVAIGHRPSSDCAGGFMRGRFHQLTPKIGVYLGVVMNRLGEPVGHIRGIYGHRKNGDPAMFGKFIDRQGKFVGLLEGTYGNGEFLARWKEVGDTDHGKIHGHYFESPNEQGGAFIARWAETACSQD